MVFIKLEVKYAAEIKHEKMLIPIKMIFWKKKKERENESGNTLSFPVLNPSVTLQV